MKKFDQFFTKALLWCFHILFLVTPLLFTWFNEELFEFNKMLFVYVMALLIGGLWIGQMAMHRHFSWKKTVFDLPIAFFLITQLLSTLFSIHPWTSVFGYYTRFHGGLLSTLAYVTLFAAFVQTIPATKVWGYFRSLAISSVIVSAIAIPEHFGRSLSCVFINSSHLAESQPLSTVLAPAQLWNSYNAQCWVQDVQTRVFATFGQPNWLAAYAITLLPVFVILAAIRKKVGEQWLFALSSIGLFVDILFTRSRSGILGLAVGIAWFSVVTGWLIYQRSSTQKKAGAWQTGRSLRVIASLVVTMVALAALFGTPYTPSVSQALQSAPPPTPVTETAPVNRLEEGGTDSGEIRKIVWTGAVDVWKRYPILGSGVETFAYSYYRDRPLAHNTVSEWDFLYNKAHNELLNFLATTGAVGLLSYLIMLTFFIGYPIYVVVKKPSITLETSSFLVALSAGLVALTVSNTLGFSTVMVTVLLFFFPAVTWVVQQAPAAAEAVAPALSSKSAKSKFNRVGQTRELENDTELEFRHYLWPIIIGLAVIFGLIFIWRTWRADYLLARGKRLSQSQQYAEGLEALENAYQLGSREGVFAEELGQTYSWLSSAFADAQQATAAALYREASLEKADEIIAKNPQNLNFYKTRTRILATLSPQEPELLAAAEQTLIKASELAPTDPKVRYNLGVIRLNLGMTTEAQADFEQAVQMKPNYEEARMSLGDLYSANGELTKALEQYRYVLDKIQPNNEQAEINIQQTEAALATMSAKTTQPVRKK